MAQNEKRIVRGPAVADRCLDRLKIQPEFRQQPRLVHGPPISKKTLDLYFRNWQKMGIRRGVSKIKQLKLKKIKINVFDYFIDLIKNKIKKLIENYI